MEARRWTIWNIAGIVICCIPANGMILPAMDDDSTFRIMSSCSLDTSCQWYCLRFYFAFCCRFVLRLLCQRLIRRMIRLARRRRRENTSCTYRRGSCRSFFWCRLSISTFWSSWQCIEPRHIFTRQPKLSVGMQYRYWFKYRWGSYFGGQSTWANGQEHVRWWACRRMRTCEMIDEGEINWRLQLDSGLATVVRPYPEKDYLRLRKYLAHQQIFL